MAEIFLAILKVIDIEKVFINKDIEKKKKLSWNGRRKKSIKKEKGKIKPEKKGMKEKLSILIFIDIDPKLVRFSCLLVTS